MQEQFPYVASSDKIYVMKKKPAIELPQMFEPHSDLTFEKTAILNVGQGIHILFNLQPSTVVHLITQIPTHLGGEFEHTPSPKQLSQSVHPDFKFF